MLINPYDLNSYKPEKVKVFQDKQKDSRKDLVNYHFDFEITGDNLNKLLLFTAGYLGQGTDNYFVIDDETIDRLIEKLSKAKKVIEESKKSKEQLKECHDTLKKYLDAGYIESITMEYKKNMLPPYYTSLLYKAFIIKPNFKKDIEIPKDVDTSFSFLEVLHLSINETEFDETMNYIRHYNDIPIHFIGYDRDKEIEKRRKEAMKDLDKKSKSGNVRMSEIDRRKYSKMLEDMNIPINVLNKK